MPVRMLLVGHSVWPARLAILLTVLALLSACSVGSAAPWWLQCSWMPVLYSCYAAAVPAQQSWLLNFGDRLQLRCYAEQTAQPLLEQHGELLPNSHICWLGIWLCWRTEQGELVRRWLFHDAMSEADFRCLARDIRQLRWQQPGRHTGLLQWFS